MTRKWSVTEATESVAFLSDEGGHDVATLHRLPAELYQSQSPLSGDDWQAMIDLVAAAPVLLEACKRFLHGESTGHGEFPCYCNDPSYEFNGGKPPCDNCFVDAAIRKAEGRVR